MNIDKIYIISMPNRYKKSLLLKSKLSNICDNISIYETDYLPGLLKQNYNIGVLGCLTSHYMCLKNALFHNYKNIMIIEDDAIINNNYENISNYLNCIPEDYDVLRFYSSKDCDSIFDENDLEITNNYYIKIEDKKYWSMVSYICNQNFMKAFIKYYDNINYLIACDYIFCDFNFLKENNINSYVTKNEFQFISIDYSKHSNIHGEEIYNKIKEQKFAVCCQVKNENLYLREFVEHYLSIGFDKIFIYDNNDINGEYPHLVLGDYIEEDKCEVVNVRNKFNKIQEAFNDCYIKNKDKYSWILYCDCDEYLEFVSESNIKDYLVNNKLYDKLAIAFNWRIISDNNNLFYNGKKLKERFTIPYETGANSHFKSFINTSLDINWTESENTHFPVLPDNMENIYIHPTGKHFNWNNSYDHSIAFLNHYINKSVIEYIFNKRQRLACENTIEEGKLRLSEDFFYAFSDKTKEKIKIFEKYKDI